jgi:hypothetical protein
MRPGRWTHIKGFQSFTVLFARDAEPALPPVLIMPVNYEILEPVKFLECWIRLLNKLQVKVKAKVEGRVYAMRYALCALRSHVNGGDEIGIYDRNADYRFLFFGGSPKEKWGKPEPLLSMSEMHGRMPHRSLHGYPA